MCCILQRAIFGLSWECQQILVEILQWVSIRIYSLFIFNGEGKSNIFLQDYNILVWVLVKRSKLRLHVKYFSTKFCYCLCQNSLQFPQCTLFRPHVRLKCSISQGHMQIIIQMPKYGKSTRCFP